MKQFLFLHYGFTKPSPEIMAEWGKWFNTYGDRMSGGKGHFPRGLEVSDDGTKALPLAEDSITGYSLVAAESLEAAENIARDCPHIAATRVYEVS